MNPWTLYIAWLSALAAMPENEQRRREEYLLRELEEDIEMLEEHGMSLWEGR